MNKVKKVFKKIINFPRVVALAFWEVLKYIWHDRKHLLIPFLLGEITYWAPFVAVCVCSIIWKNPLWATSFYAFYVGVLPAIPIQIALTFGYYALFRKLRGKNTDGIKEETQALIDKIKSIK